MLYVQELVHEDFDRRIEFCELIEARGNDFVNNMLIIRIGASKNPHWMRDNKS